MQQKETTTLEPFFSDMEEEEKKRKNNENKEEETESDQNPSKKKEKEENDDRIPNNISIVQKNKKENIPSKTIVFVVTTYTSKPKKDKNGVSPKKKERMQQYIDSCIDMYNCILDDYGIKKKFSYVDVDMLLEKYSYYQIKKRRLWELIILGCPGNNKILKSGINKEMKIGKSIFGTLINFKFKKLYEYFKKDGTVITKDGKIFIHNGVFKTLKDFSK
jgi:hypothetical protein